MAVFNTVIEGLELCVQGSKGCLKDCPYTDKGCRVQLEKDALELLKEQPQIVRCKDCKHYAEYGVCHTFSPKADWFCGNGEMKGEE